MGVDFNDLDEESGIQAVWKIWRLLPFIYYNSCSGSGSNSTFYFVQNENEFTATLDLDQGEYDVIVF
jgi:hypothetical protein